MINHLQILIASIHPHPLVGPLTVAIGLILGASLALSDWKKKFALGSLLTTAGGAIASASMEKFAVVRDVMQSTALLTPLLVALNVALATFIVALVVGTSCVYAVNLLVAKRRGDPEAVFLAGQRAWRAFSGGLLEYSLNSPDCISRKKITELESANRTLGDFLKTLAREPSEKHGRQHFVDTMSAAGRLFLQETFTDGSDLERYRLAFFERRGGRLEYCIKVNNGDWTSHSGEGFSEAECFMGRALQKDRYVLFPKEKKRRDSFRERKDSRYNSFIAMPVPCGQGKARHVGIVTVDYTGSDDVFTEARIEMLFAFSQILYGFYLLNDMGQAVENPLASSKSVTNL